MAQKRRAMSRLLCVVLVLLAVAAGPVAAIPASSPGSFPGVPSQPPPPIPPGPFRGSGPVIEYDLPAGWSMISFPLASLEGASGFRRAICRWTPRGYVAIDPVNAPHTVDTGCAYAVYADVPATVKVRGRTAPLPRTLQLHAGWNMIGCPSPQPIPWRQVSLTGPAGVTRCIEEAAGPDRAPRDAWVYARGHVSPAGRDAWIDLRGPDAALLPGEDTWIFAWEDVTMNWNEKAPTAHAPHIDATRLEGREVEIRGSGFGPSGAGVVTIDSVAMRPQDIVSWSDDQIRFRVPYETVSGPLCVMVNRFPSNVVTLKLPPPAERGGTLKGRIETSGGKPLADAQIMLDSGQIATTDASGAFRLDGIPAGTYTAHITKMGYNAGRGEIRVEAGATRSLLVSLSALGGGASMAPPEARGTLWVEAFRYTAGGRTRWVKQIRVSEYGDSRRRWTSPSWSTDAQSRSLQCTRVPLDRRYTVRTTWTDATGSETTSTVYRKMTSRSQTVRVYAP